MAQGQGKGKGAGKNNGSVNAVYRHLVLMQLLIGALPTLELGEVAAALA